MSWESAAPCLVCPLCGASLRRVGGALKCARSHSFDLAREGYLNLLLSQHRASRSLGDSREMLLARCRFLKGGHYRVLSDAISGLACRHLGACARHSGRSGEAYVLDAGCGEGYYLGQVQHELASRPGHDGINYVGIDVAKDAARLAARRYPGLEVVVADISGHLPIAEAPIHLLLNVFAPRNPSEFFRILAPSGMLAIVVPTPSHLVQVREAFPLLRIESDKRQRVIERLARYFELTESRSIEYETGLSGRELGDLVWMMPSYRHLTPAAVEVLGKIESIQTTVGFDLLAFQRIPRAR